MAKVKVTLSHGSDSKSVLLESDSDEIISIGDLFQFEESHWSVTRIEIGDKMSVDSCQAKEIVSMWSVNKDTCVVKITLTDEENSISSTIDCDPEKEFSCGTVMRIDGRRWRIRAIHTGEGRTLRGKRVMRRHTQNVPSPRGKELAISCLSMALREPLLHALQLRGFHLIS